MKKVIMLSIVCSSMLCGCITEPKIEPTKPWEGRYTSLEAASKALDQAATTENDTQVWLLQPSTLNRLLKNVGN